VKKNTYLKKNVGIKSVRITEVSTPSIIPQKATKRFEHLLFNEGVHFLVREVNHELLIEIQTEIRRILHLKIDFKKKGKAKLGKDQNQMLYKTLPDWVSLLLSEECRAYLIDFRTEWFGNSRRTWYINLTVNFKTFMFVLSVHLGLMLSKTRRLLLTGRKPMF
jgi:hypothetical protein